MNTNGFFSGSGVQALAPNDRFRSLFQASSSVPEGRASKTESPSSLSLNLVAGESSGRQVFSKSIEFTLGIKFEASYEFKVPSPQDVASTVLGFVENRINMEKQSGTSLERLNNLMAQAKSGIEKGYAQAEKDLNDLGLMNDELAEDISTGFNLINEGLDDISDTLSAAPLGVSDANDSKALTQKQGDTENLFTMPSLKAIDAGIKLDETRFVSIDKFTRSTSDFVLNTREGDQILIRMADSTSLSYAKNAQGESLGLASMRGFEFSIKGDINDNELQAINNLLEQVETISSLFFDDKFEEAFNSALSLGFDSEQIASFSLDLSKLQVQEVRTYQESTKTALDAYKRNQPLINVTQQFEKLDTLMEPLARFEKVNDMIEALISKAVEAYSIDAPDADKDNRLLENYSLFSNKLVNAILSE